MMQIVKVIVGGTLLLKKLIKNIKIHQRSIKIPYTYNCYTLCWVHIYGLSSFLLMSNVFFCFFVLLLFFCVCVVVVVVLCCCCCFLCCYCCCFLLSLIRLYSFASCIYHITKSSCCCCWVCVLLWTFGTIRCGLFINHYLIQVWIVTEKEREILKQIHRKY